MYFVRDHFGEKVSFMSNFSFTLVRENSSKYISLDL